MPKDKVHVVLLSNERQSMDLILGAIGATLLYFEHGIARLWQNLTPAQASRLSSEAAAYYGDLQ